MTVTAQIDKLQPEAITMEERSPFQIVMRRFVRHRLAMISYCHVGDFIITILAPYITSFGLMN